MIKSILLQRFYLLETSWRLSQEELGTCRLARDHARHLRWPLPNGTPIIDEECHRNRD